MNDQPLSELPADAATLRPLKKEVPKLDTLLDAKRLRFAFSVSCHQVCLACMSYHEVCPVCNAIPLRKFGNNLAAI